MKTNLNYETEEQKELQKLLVIILIVVIVIGLVYGLSKMLMNGEVEERTFAPGAVNSEAIVVGTILNRPETEYFVICYDSKGQKMDALLNYGNNYSSTKSGAIKVYYLDLSNNLNKNYYVQNESNPKAKSVKEMKIKDGTIIRVKRNEVREYIEGLDEIGKRLNA